MLVSIIIPCYNQGRFLNDCLQSVFKQTYAIWECIIIDDGSTDKTQQVAEKWTKNDFRFHFIKIPNQGVSAARNVGLSRAKGEWIQFLDADDYLDPTKLNKSIQIYKNDKTVNFIVTNFRHFTTDFNVTTPAFCNLKKEYLTVKKMLYEWNDTFSLPIHTVLLKKELVGDLLFPVGLTAQEDWFFWVSIFKKKCHIYFIDKPLVLYRSHANSRIKSKSINADQLKVYSLFPQLLSKQEHEQLSIVLIERYLNKISLSNNQIQNLKKSNSYQAGIMIKKILRRLALLKIGRKLFLYLRTFKKTDY